MGDATGLMVDGMSWETGMERMGDRRGGEEANRPSCGCHVFRGRLMTTRHRRLACCCYWGGGGWGVVPLSCCQTGANPSVCLPTCLSVRQWPPLSFGFFARRSLGDDSRGGMKERRGGKKAREGRSVLEKKK